MVNRVVHEVSTLNLADVQRATRFDVLTLLNVALTRPYLHDGSLSTI
ncbi:MAG TPA: hypothetical protein PKE45_09530 [Caldilineaceae bacterium]|nr:hypothetical protein [Caldilineaceae bacterium]